MLAKSISPKNNQKMETKRITNPIELEKLSVPWLSEIQKVYPLVKELYVERDLTDEGCVNWESDLGFMLGVDNLDNPAHKSMLQKLTTVHGYKVYGTSTIQHDVLDAGMVQLKQGIRKSVCVCAHKNCFWTLEEMKAFNEKRWDQQRLESSKIEAVIIKELVAKKKQTGT